MNNNIEDLDNEQEVPSNEHPYEEEEEEEDMEERHLGFTQEQYNTGRFLGVNFPYVAEDPFW